MALPIKETPTLEGKDAKKFLKEMQKNKKRISSKERSRMEKNYKFLINAAKKNNTF